MSNRKRLRNGRFGTIEIRECTRSLFQLLYNSSPITHKTLEKNGNDTQTLGRNVLYGKSNEGEKALFINGKFITGISCIKYILRREGNLILLQSNTGDTSLIVDSYGNEIARDECSIDELLNRKILNEFNSNKNIEYTTWNCKTKHFIFQCKTVSCGKYHILKMYKYSVINTGVVQQEAINLIVDANKNEVLNNEIYGKITDLSEWSICRIWKGLYECEKAKNTWESEKIIIDLSNDAHLLVGSSTHCNYIVDGYYMILKEVAGDSYSEAWIAKFNPKTRVLERITPYGNNISAGYNRSNYKMTAVVFKRTTLKRRIENGETASIVAEVYLRSGNQLGKRHTYRKTKRQILEKRDKVV